VGVWHGYLDVEIDVWSYGGMEGCMDVCMNLRMYVCSMYLDRADTQNYVF